MGYVSGCDPQSLSFWGSPPTSRLVISFPRYPLIPISFPAPAAALMFLLGILDFLFVNHAYHSILTRGASVQLVFGFEVGDGFPLGTDEPPGTDKRLLGRVLAPYRALPPRSTPSS